MWFGLYLLPIYCFALFNSTPYFLLGDINHESYRFVVYKPDQVTLLHTTTDTLCAMIQLHLPSAHSTTGSRLPSLGSDPWLSDQPTMTPVILLSEFRFRTRSPICTNHLQLILVKLCNLTEDHYLGCRNIEALC